MKLEKCYLVPKEDTDTFLGLTEDGTCVYVGNKVIVKLDWFNLENFYFYSEKYQIATDTLEELKEQLFDKEIEQGFAENCFCDNYGFCGGSSCKNYANCKM